MKTKLPLFCLFALLLFTTCKKEDVLVNPDLTIYFEGRFNDLCTNENNEIIMIGTNDDHDPPSFCNDFIIMKTDQDGNQIWSKKYIIDIFIHPEKIIQTAPGEYFIAITKEYDHPQWAWTMGILVVQINDDGEIVHQNLLELYHGIRFNDMIPDRVNGVIVTGKAFDDDNPGGVAKISNSGEVEFFHQYPFGTEQITQYPLGELCYLEYAFLNNDTRGAAVHLTSPVGDELFHGTILKENNYIFTRFSEDPNHLIMFYLGTNGKFLEKIDYNSQVVWFEQVKFIESDNGMILDLVKIGGYYYCLGEHGLKRDAIGVIKYDETGEKIYQRNFKLINMEYDPDHHFTEMDNGSILFLEPVEHNPECQSDYCYALQIFK